LIDSGTTTRKSTLLLIPGRRMTAAIWHDQIRALGKDRKVVAIDPRSQGQSTTTPEGDTPERARDLHNVAEQLNLKPMVMVKWPQGVQDAAAYVDQFRTEGLEGVVLIDADGQRAK
jgi:non-heme chloroperoxidase